MTTLYKGFFTVEIVDTPQGSREVIRATNSVSILFYNLSNQTVLLIREPRTAMITKQNPQGLTIGNVAGRFDVDLSPRALAVKEAWEEAGITIKEEDIIMLNDSQPMAVNAGMTDEKCYLAFATIGWDNYEPDEKLFGNTEEGEKIERVWMSIEKFKKYQPECLKVFALQQWFLKTSYCQENKDER